MTPLKYLMDQLKFPTQQWTGLPDKDKDDLKRWAQEELDLAK
jgi:hypothetical protein